jgi:hypothetical protein
MTMPAGPQDPPGGGQDQPPQPVFPRLEDWMDQYFLPMFCRPQGGSLRWCPKWWLHPEAVTRLTGCWLSWEAFRLDPATGISDWLRDHLDYHLSVLTDQRGPFFQCSPEGGHIAPRRFPSDPVDFTDLAGLS